METLVQIAKRLGIKPNPKINDVSYFYEPIFQEIEKKYGTRPRYGGGIIDPESIYVLRKYLQKERSWDQKKAAQQVRFLKTTAQPGISIFAQQGAVKLGSNGSFIYHSASGGAKTKERFQIDLKMDSPHMEPMWQKLDNFIKKYHAAYKVVDLDGGEHTRTDTLNLYMSEEITPEIAKELYEIVGSFLEPKYDEFLDGFNVRLNGKIIKGFKYGPEPIDVGDATREKWADYIQQIAARDLPPFFVDLVAYRQLEQPLSLGEFSCKIQAIDLFYYLAGKEGKNPFQLGNQFGDPKKPKYDKIIDLADAGQSMKKVSATKAPLIQKISKNSVTTGKISSAPVQSLIPKVFVDSTKGTKGTQYLDKKGNIVATETYFKNCTKRVYTNGLAMFMWYHPQSITLIDNSVQAKQSAEVFVMDPQKGYTKIQETTGELRKKIECVRNMGLFTINLPTKPSALQKKLIHHSSGCSIKGSHNTNNNF